MESPPQIACLLPVRNGEELLPAWLAGASSWCDAVVALDDGSTDATGDLLRASPLVRVLLQNPRRDTFAGWDDGANRARLLVSASRLAPSWILWVDVDEQIPADDAAAMRSFLATDAIPGCAYGLRHLRMWGEDRYDASRLWVYRLFAWRPDHSLPAERLHFNPVPTAIPRQAWMRTSLRLLHFTAPDDEGRRARRAKYLEADPSGEFETGFGGLDDRPEILESLGPRDPGVPVLLPASEQLGVASLLDRARERHRAAEGDVEPGGSDEDRPLVVALLPARDAVDDLPDWFESIARVADAVVALDDGSSDATRIVLAGHPMVRVLIANEPTADHRWDDAANRQALLDASAQLRPRWIISIDADERLDADDAAALRSWLESGDADPTAAYGFLVHRMIGDGAHYDRADLWVYRLFAWEPDARFPPDRLHFVPVPTTIPRHRFRRTTVRIQHVGSATEQRRADRFAKYRAADPELELQSDYGELLSPPGELRPWERRPAQAPVPVDEAKLDSIFDELGGRVDIDAVSLAAALDDEVPDPDAPVLSAVVIARDDEDRIERAVSSVVEQDCPEPFEVIVVSSGGDRTAEIVRERFPDVTLIELSRPALPGEARNAGLAVARGDYVSFPGSHVVLAPGSLAARIRAHERGYPMVTGTTLNANPTRAGWASYFLDHSSLLPGRPSEELGWPPSHCSYDREFLMSIGGFPEGLRSGEDTFVNTKLFMMGYRAYREADVRLYHESPCRTLRQLARHHFQRGRGLGLLLLELGEPGAPVLQPQLLRRMLLGYLPRRLLSTAANVRHTGDDRLRAELAASAPLVALGAMAAWAGTWLEILRPQTGKLRRLVGTPALHVAVAGLDRRGPYAIGRTDVLLLARVEPVRGRIRLLSVPRDLAVEIPGVGPGRLNEAYYHGAGGTGDGLPDAGRAGSSGSPTTGNARAGMRALRATLQRALGTRVDGCVLVDFEGFRDLVDALGGVEVEVPHAIDDEFVAEDGERFAAHFRPGPQRLSGERALVYARTRKSDGDTWRRRRHADLISGLLHASGRALRSPLRSAEAFRAAASALRTDLGPVRVVLVAVTALRASRGSIDAEHLGAPIVRSIRNERGRWVHVGDPDRIARWTRTRLAGVEEPEETGGAGEAQVAWRALGSE